VRTPCIAPRLFLGTLHLVFTLNTDLSRYEAPVTLAKFINSFSMHRHFVAFLNVGSTMPLPPIAVSNSRGCVSNVLFRWTSSRKAQGRSLQGMISRVTNGSREVQQGTADAVYQAALDAEEEEGYIWVDAENPIPRPELGPLERRVSMTFEEGLESEEVDPEAEEYWFNEPPGGWKTGKIKLKTPQILPTEAVDEFRHPVPSTEDEEDGDEGVNAKSSSSGSRQSRRPIEQLRPGDKLQGTVVAQILHHGLQVDVGASADGLIWVSGAEAWHALGDLAPEPGHLIDVEVFAVRPHPIFRFPLQLRPADPELAALMPRPEDHVAPLDLRDVPIHKYAEIAALSGREWAPTEAMIRLTPETGVDDSEEGDEEMDVISEEELAEYDEAALGL
jgi:hypothetical protein